jgi:putative transposase
MVVLVRTVSVPLELTSNQSQLLLNTFKVASDAYNDMASYAVQNKIISKQKLHTGQYAKLRLKYPSLPSAYLQSLRDQMIEGLKSIHSNHPKKKWKITPSKSHYSALRLDGRSFTMRGNQLTISTVDKRLKTIVHIPSWFTSRYPDHVQGNAATLSYRKQSKRFFLNLVYQTTAVEVNPVRTQTIGIDRGIYKLAVTSDGDVYSSKQVRAKRREQRYLRSKLQQKGTPSAKQHLRKLSGTEKRFMLDHNNKITKQIITNNPLTKTIVLEKLTGITKKRKSKTLNALLHQWNFYQFEQLLTYKAAQVGVDVVHIDPRYTSQRCNQCGVINKNNRVKNKYNCSCGWSADADYNAALNIRDIQLNNSPRWYLEQGAVNHPNVTNLTV